MHLVEIDVPDTYEDRIAWVMEHPQMSDWLKDAVRTALDRDPVDLLSDLEMLEILLRPRAQIRIDALRSAVVELHDTGSAPQSTP